MGLFDDVKYFFQAMSVPSSVRKEGSDAVRYYHSLEVPEYVSKLGRGAVRQYKSVKAVLNTPRASESRMLCLVRAAGMNSGDIDGMGNVSERLVG